MIVDLLLSKFLNDQDQYCNNVYKLIYNIINFWEQYRKYITLFYETNFKKSNEVFNISTLINQNTIIHSTTLNWCFEIDINKFKLFESKEFVKNLKEQINIYVLVVVNIKMTKKQLESSEISKDYLYIKRLFDNEKTKIWSEQNQKNHVLNLMKNTKSLYMSLDNLFQKKLTKLERYLIKI